ncbi:MAG TPA: nuclear transport factor 2 family protein [Thermoanaerobaculia bacterium]|nr:nuclear transport factor 2 family protein [Thermoanaerobaculia bacterium]
MKRSVVVWSLAAFAALPSLAATVDRQAALDGVVAAEKAFAKAAAEKGTRAAFLAYLADDSIVLAPGPEPGKEAWESRPASTNYLTWFPVQADVSLAGDLGYTTGPWELRPDGKADTHVVYGFYTTVWHKQADGSLKVLYDGGCTTPKPPASATAVKIGKANPAQVVDPPAVEEARGKAELLAADRALAKAVAAKGTGAFAGVLDDGARLHREGAVPVVSKAAVLKALKAQKGKMAWSPILARISSSADLGFTLGKEAMGMAQGHYVRIWKKQPDKSWRVVVDLFSPLPPEPSAAPGEKPKKNPHHKP